MTMSSDVCVRSFVRLPSGAKGDVVRVYYGTAWVRLSSGLVVTCREDLLEVMCRSSCVQGSLF